MTDVQIKTFGLCVHILALRPDGDPEFTVETACHPIRLFAKGVLVVTLHIGRHQQVVSRKVHEAPCTAVRCQTAQLQSAAHRMSLCSGQVIQPNSTYFPTPRHYHYPVSLSLSLSLSPTP